VQRLWLVLQIQWQSRYQEEAVPYDVTALIGRYTLGPWAVRTFLISAKAHRVLDIHTPVHRIVASELRERYGTDAAYNGITIPNLIAPYNVTIRTWGGDAYVEWALYKPGWCLPSWSASLADLPAEWTFYDLALAMGIV
jgi:hypothetical protein